MPTMRLTPAALFELLLRDAGIDGYVKNYRFHAPVSRREIDYAWVELRCGAEIDEETCHSHWRKQSEDRQKGNIALLTGWRLLRFSGAMLRDDPDRCIAQLRELLGHGAVHI